MSPHFPCMYIIHTCPHLRFLRSTLASLEQILWSGPNSLFTCYFVGKSITWSFAKDLYFYAFFSYHLFRQLGESVFRKHFSTCYLFDFIIPWQYWKGEIKDDTFSNNTPRPHWPPWLVCLFSAPPLSLPRESGQTNIFWAKHCAFLKFFLAEEGNHVKRPNLIAQQRKKEKAMK